MQYTNTWHQQPRPQHCMLYAMAQTVGRRRLTEDVPVRSQTNPVRICDVHIGTTIGFCPSTLVSPRHSRSTNAAYTFINLSQMP